LESRQVKKAFFTTGLSQSRSRKAAREVSNLNTFFREVKPTRPQNRFDVQMTPGLWKTFEKSAAKNVSYDGMLQYRQRIARMLMRLEPSGPRMSLGGSLGVTSQDAAEN
jgi:hypothetical protein